MATNAIPYAGLKQLAARYGVDPSLIPNGSDSDVTQLASPYPLTAGGRAAPIPGSNIDSLPTADKAAPLDSTIPIFGPAAQSANAAAPTVGGGPSVAGAPIGNVSSPAPQMPQYKPSVPM